MTSFGPNGNPDEHEGATCNGRKQAGAEDMIAFHGIHLGLVSTLDWYLPWTSASDRTPVCRLRSLRRSRSVRQAPVDPAHGMASWLPRAKRGPSMGRATSRDELSKCERSKRSSGRERARRHFVLYVTAALRPGPAGAGLNAGGSNRAVPPGESPQRAPRDQSDRAPRRREDPQSFEAERLSPQ